MAIDILNKKEYQIHTLAPEKMLHTPWSEVYLFKTNHGFIFLKKVPSALSLEAKIIYILDKEFHASVPYIIAKNDEQHCFLMKDAGIPLYDYFKENFQEDILIKTMHDYIALQIKTIDQIDQFFNVGVPDWRLEKLPTLYHELISHEDLLIEDGLSKDELIKLKELEPKFLRL